MILALYLGYDIDILIGKSSHCFCLCPFFFLEQSLYLVSTWRLLMHLSKPDHWKPPVQLLSLTSPSHGLLLTFRVPPLIPITNNQLAESVMFCLSLNPHFPYFGLWRLCFRLPITLVSLLGHTINNLFCSFATVSNLEVPLLFLPAFTSLLSTQQNLHPLLSLPLYGTKPSWLYKPHVITNPSLALTDHAIKSKLLSPSIKVLTFPSMTSPSLLANNPHSASTFTVSQTFLYPCLWAHCSL